MDAEFLSAVDEIYSAATDVSRWPRALSAIALCTSDVGAILIWQRSDGNFATVTSPELAAAQADYVAKWHRFDVRAQRAIARDYWLTDEVFTDHDGLSEHEIATLPFYTEFLAKHGLKWGAEIGVSTEPGFLAALSIQRASEKGPFSVEEREIVRRIGRHVENALRISRRLLEEEGILGGLTAALDQAGMGVLTLDDEGRILFANDKAQALFGRTLTIANGRLILPRTDKPERTAESLTDEMAPRLHPTANHILLRDQDGTTTALFLSSITPNRNQADRFMRQSTRIGLTITSRGGEPLDPMILRDALGLTLGEARVASLIEQGQSPKIVAEKLSISVNTVRTVLKAIFSKTGLSRQSQLAILVDRMSF